MSASAGSNGTDEQPTSSTPVPPEAETPNKLQPSRKDADKNLAINFLHQGKRHLVVRDFQSAIESLGEACRLLTENEPEETAPPGICFENSEAHFFYGKALLEQSRLELGVLEGPELGKCEEASDEEDFDEDKSEDDDEDEESAFAVNNESGEADSSEATANGLSETPSVSNEKPPHASSTTHQQEPAVTSSNEADKIKPAETQDSEVDLNAPSPSVASGIVVDNEQPSTSSLPTVEAVSEKQADEELSNLELAWEVLEVAKIGYRSLLNEMSVKKGLLTDNDEESKKLVDTEKMVKKRLADTHCSLGEVATESESYNQAIDEFRTGLDILDEIEGSDSREIAQYYFQMGLAFSFDKRFPDAINSFKKSVEIIEMRISTLKHKIKSNQTSKDLGVELEDPSRTEADEVQELTALLPELQEKITDTVDAEKESKAMEEEDKQEQEIILRNSPVKNPNPPAAKDISHLVKKKKKAEDSPLDEPPVKKQCTGVLEATPSGATPADEMKLNGSEENSIPPASLTPSSNGHSSTAESVEA